MGRISAILDIENMNIAEAVSYKISNDNTFTNVVNSPYSEITRTGLALLSLHTSLSGEPELYVCILKKERRIATGQVRLKGIKPIKLPEISIEKLIEELPPIFRNKADNFFDSEYEKLPPRFGEELFNSIKTLKNDLADVLENLFAELNTPLRYTITSREEDTAIEKDALGLCLDIFGVDRSSVFSRWSRNGGNLGNSFLNGLKDFTVYEDDVIAHDLHKFPGFNVLKTFAPEVITGVVEFESESGDRLTVINANRKPAEKAMGVDLIYFHRRFESFIMVQYKMMDQRTEENDNYYNPNHRSHNDEIERLKSLRELIEKEKKQRILAEYRLSDCSLFFKLCKKIELKMDDYSLAPGMYVPLEQWELLLEDQSTLGKRGGRQFGYHTLKKRYINKETFVSLVQSGFIGTAGNVSTKIAAFLEDAISNGKSVMYAVDERMNSAPSRKQPIYNPNIYDENSALRDNHNHDEDLPF